MNRASHREIWSLPANPEFIIFESPRSSWAGWGSKYLIWIQQQIIVEKIPPSIGWLRPLKMNKCIGKMMSLLLKISIISPQRCTRWNLVKSKMLELVCCANSSDLTTCINMLTKQPVKVSLFVQSVCLQQKKAFMLTRLQWFCAAGTLPAVFLHRCAVASMKAAVSSPWVRAIFITKLKTCFSSK